MKYKPLDCPPAVTIPSTVDVPGFATHHTPAGATVYSIKSSELDLVRISVVFRAGSRYQHHPFTASATVDMLAEGTASHTSEELSRMLDYYGIYYSTSIDRDYSVITLCCLNRFLDETLCFLSEILSEPLFSDS
ncbi:MAG: insulinase family protein, partial [Rikenellaceae bacterium]|nr:insulinase family protein [Rikenellaceae bacterium]